MKAILLAGGKGTRLRPITDTIPKPLIPLADKTCIEYVVESLVHGGFKDIIVTTGYRGDQIVNKLGDGGRYDAHILYSAEERPAGTAGAVKLQQAFLDDTFIVASGDVLADINIQKLYDFHKQKNALATIALATVDNPTEFGIMELDENGAITRFKEKPREDEVFSNLINAGIYVLEPAVLDMIPPHEPFDFSKNLFPVMLDEGAALYGSHVSGRWIDIGRPSDLLRATRKILETDERKRIFTQVDIALSARVENSYLHKNTAIGAGSGVIDSILMPESRVGRRCEIKNSIICERCVIEDDVSILNSVVAPGSVVTKGTTIEMGF